MSKLSKKEYIIKAARLYGLAEHEIKDLENHIDGKDKNDYIVKRNAKLFKLYDTYISPEYNEHIRADENGIINLDDYLFIISQRRLQDSKIGRNWLISSNLDSYLITNKHSSDINGRWINISEKNNFLLPQVAKQLGLEATVYYKGRFPEESSKNNVFFMTKDFIKSGETLIQGETVYKRKKDRVKVDFEDLLSETDKYIKRYYKKHKFSQEESEEARKSIREGLIKQTIFNKLVLNDNEGNSKWGLIQREDNRLRLAPIYSFDYCLGVESYGKSHRRAIRRREDIGAFIKKYGNEKWFSTWIREKVLTLDINKAVEDMTEGIGVKLTDKEEEYYKYALERNLTRIKEAYQQNLGEGDSPQNVKNYEDATK